MATFLQDNIILYNNSRIKNPIPQGAGIPAAGSSFDFSSNFYYNAVGTSNMYIINSTSPLVMKVNGVLQGMWASLATAADGQYHDMIRFKNGNVIRAMCQSSDPNSIYFDLQNINGGRFWQFALDVLRSNYRDVAFVIIDNGNGTYKFAQSGSANETNGHFTHWMNNISYTSNFITPDCIKPQLVWKSIKSIDLANPKDLGFDANLAPLNNQSTMLISYIPDEALEEDSQVIGGKDFVVKAPSLDDFITQYGSQDFTSKSIFLSNKNYVTIGKKNVGLSGTQYKFSFLSKFDPPNQQINFYETTISVGLGDGIPYLGFITDTNNEFVKLNVIFIRTIVDQATGIKTKVADFNTITMSDAEMQSLKVWMSQSFGYDTDNDSGAENPDQGGDETDEVTNTPLNRLTLPTRGAVGSGFVKVYEVGDTELQDICDFMWDDSLITNLGRLFSDPREIIVGLMVFPIMPSNKQSNSPIYAGNLDTGVTGNLLLNEYETRYAGSRRIPKGNSDFMSFAPYRRIKIDIPYCGEHELDPSAVYGATLKLYYHISFFSGNCVAELTRTFDDGEEEPFAFFGGQMGYSIPLSSEDFTRTLSSLISAGISVGSALCTYGASSAAAGAAKTAEKAAIRQSAANATLGGAVASGVGGLLDGSLAPNVSYNTGGGANSGFLGCQQPYIIMDCPIPAYDGSQSSYIGYTYYKTKKLNDCDGYTKCFEAHIEGVHATDSELEEIVSWLTHGVIIHHNGSATPSDTPSVSGNTVINFMKLTSEVNVIGKSWTDVTPIEGKLIFDQSISSPSILVNSNALRFNYVYIGLFNRFYFVSDTIVRNTDLIEVKLKSDPLQSFKDEILDCYASVDRQKNNGNKFIEDPYLWKQINNDVNILPFIDDGIEFDFGHNQDSYILTIAGKG